MGWAVAVIGLIAVGLAGRWLFRQRTPEEIIAARGRMRRLRGKAKSE